MDPSVKEDQSWSQTAQAGAFGMRLLFWIGALIVLAVVAFFVGASRFTSSNCSDSGFYGECDLASMAGLAWAGVTIVLGIVVMVAVEIVRAKRQ